MEPDTRPAYGHKVTGEVVPAKNVRTRPGDLQEFAPDVAGPVDLAEWESGVFGPNKEFHPGHAGMLPKSGKWDVSRFRD